MTINHKRSRLNYERSGLKKIFGTFSVAFNVSVSLLRKSCDYFLTIYMKKFEMVKKKKRNQGKKYTINCAILGVCLI